MLLLPSEDVAKRCCLWPRKLVLTRYWIFQWLLYFQPPWLWENKFLLSISHQVYGALLQIAQTDQNIQLLYISCSKNYFIYMCVYTHICVYKDYVYIKLYICVCVISVFILPIQVRYRTLILLSSSIYNFHKYFFHIHLEPHQAVL